MLLIYHWCYQIFGVMRMSALRQLPPQGSYVNSDGVLLAQMSLLDRFYETGTRMTEPSTFYLLREYRQKRGVNVLIQAFRILADNRPALRLDLVGGAYTQAYLYLAPDPDDLTMASLEPFYGTRFPEMVRRQFILKGQACWDDLGAAAGGDDRIVFHGAIPHAETIAIYRRAAVRVLPSVWNEPSPVADLRGGRLRIAYRLNAERWHPGDCRARADWTTGGTRRCRRTGLGHQPGDRQSRARTRDGSGRSATDARWVHLGGVGATPCRSD
jgi:hypothetical protein